MHTTLSLRWGGNDPLCIAHHCFSAEHYPDLLHHFAAASGISDLIRRLGIADFRRSDTAISARAPTGDEADYLRIPKTSSVVVLEGRNVDSEWPSDRGQHLNLAGLADPITFVGLQVRPSMTYNDRLLHFSHVTSDQDCTRSESRFGPALATFSILKCCTLHEWPVW